MYCMQNLLENWILGGNSVVDKTLRKLHKATRGVSRGSALRLRLTGSVVQPLICYDLLSYKAIGSNYLSFVVTSMLVFHIATG